MSAARQIRVPDEAPVAPPGGDTLQILRDAIARLNSTAGVGTVENQAELDDLLTVASEAVERAKVIARATTQCEAFLRDGRFDEAFEILDGALLAYPADPALLARRRNAEERQKAFESSAAVRLAIGEAQWLLDQDRPDFAARFLSRKAAELPGEPELLSRLSEIEAILRQWEGKRQVRSALEQASALEQREQWPTALTVLEEALQTHPASTELIAAVKRVGEAQADHERRKKLARRVDQIKLRIGERAWSAALTVLAAAEEEFPGALELTPLRREAEAGLKTSKCEAVSTEVRQSLADGELELAERLLRRGVAVLGPQPVLEALRVELDSEKEYRESLRVAQTLFGRRQIEEAESILARLVVRDRPEAQALLETVRRARAAAEEERFCDEGRENALALMGRGQFEEAVDVLRNLLSLFPRNPILERDLKAAESALDLKSPTPGPPAGAEHGRAGETQRPIAVASPPLNAPTPPALPTLNLLVESPRSGFRRTLIIGAAALAVVAAGGAAWQLSRSDSPVADAVVKPALTTMPTEVATPLPAAESKPAPAPKLQTPLPPHLPAPVPTSSPAAASPASSMTPPATPLRAFVAPPTGPAAAQPVAVRVPGIAPPQVESATPLPLPSALAVTVLPSSPAPAIASTPAPATTFSTRTPQTQMIAVIRTIAGQWTFANPKARRPRITNGFQFAPETVSVNVSPDGSGSVDYSIKPGIWHAAETSVQFRFRITSWDGRVLSGKSDGDKEYSLTLQPAQTNLNLVWHALKRGDKLHINDGEAALTRNPSGGSR